jgi:F0F1-type ATP synthase epsilon subunit
MYLKVLSLKGIEYEGEAKSFNAKALDGEITVLDNHRPLITILKKGAAVIIEKNDSQKKIEINSGFLEMNSQNRLNVLID